MQTILEKACQTLAGENMAAAASGSYNKAAAGPDISGMKDFGPTMNFPSLQDLNIYGGGGGDQLELHHQSMERSSMDAAFIPNSDNFMPKKRPNPYSTNSGKSPLIWADDLRLQELGSAAALDDHQLQMGPLSIDRGPGEIDSVSDIYEAKPMLSGDHSIGDKKLDRPSPRRTAAISAGGMVQGRGSPFG